MTLSAIQIDLHSLGWKYSKKTPAMPGIYLFLCKRHNEEDWFVGYVGQSRNMGKRRAGHVLALRILQCEMEAVEVFYFECSDTALNRFERKWIRKFKPRYNVSMPGGNDRTRNLYNVSLDD